MITSILTAVSLLGAACASSVTPVVAAGGCGNIHSYYPYTGTTGYFMVTVSGCVDASAPDHTCAIEGFRDTVVPSGNDKGYLAIGFRGDLAIVQIMCSDASPSAIDACVNFGQQGCEFQSIRVQSDASSGHLMWGLSTPESIPVEYYHHVVDGKQQEGLFIGAQNVTSWAIKQHAADEYSEVPYWLPRLLGPEQKLEEGELKTFLQVNYF
ncbi:hypothetical protein EYZ11_005482 [Aspergillus tanneri]|uniref:Uncharacterized protein n=1 Tax=Aspergillus tanneri TaxID=1220188 RepID=A0A4V6RQU5_9EURO|nr:uncharacterized protein ATNIH1004_008113 [Aspergillus tanneri]KAA8643917.1 hypothetical protein ATNIH1004_008113 [Aspergillus tanneri]THC95044.1 hypothetical protein EYZ11_005482 [Aspergillus tanneri]